MEALAFRYPIHLEEAPEGGFVVTFPDFPEAVSEGDSLGEALCAASDCLDEAIAARIHAREAIPAASSATGPVAEASVLVAAKAALYGLMREQGLTFGAMARRLEVAETEVRRLLDPRHATRMSRVEDALRRFGKRLRVEVESV